MALASQRRLRGAQVNACSGSTKLCWSGRMPRRALFTGSCTAVAVAGIGAGFPAVLLLSLLPGKAGPTGWLQMQPLRARAPQLPGAFDAGATLTGVHMTSGGEQGTSVIARRGVMEPPVRTRPPDVETEVRAKASEWTECLLEDTTLRKDTDAPGQLRVETWVFRTADYDDFMKLLKLRMYSPSQTTLSCRERSIDAEVRCQECVRVLRGGFYGALGVSVQAYPPQPEALGCLALSKLIDMPPPSTHEDDSGDWDGAQGKQTAFCNSVNARFEKVEA